MGDNLAKLRAFLNTWNTFLTNNFYNNPAMAGLLNSFQKNAGLERWTQKYNQLNSNMPPSNAQADLFSTRLDAIKTAVREHFAFIVQPYPAGLSVNLPQVFLTSIMVALNNDNPTFVNAVEPAPASASTPVAAVAAAARDSNSSLLNKFITDVYNYITSSVFQNDNVRLVLNQGLVPAYIMNLNNSKATLETNLPRSITTEQDFKTNADAIQNTFTNYFAGLKDRSNNSLPQQFLSSALDQITKLRPNNPLTVAPAVAIAPTPAATVARDTNSSLLNKFMTDVYNYITSSVFQNESVRLVLNQGLVPAYIANLNNLKSALETSLPATITSEQDFKTNADAIQNAFANYFAGLKDRSNNSLPQQFLSSALDQITKLRPNNPLTVAPAAAASVPAAGNRDTNSKALFDYVMAMYNYTIKDFFGNPAIRATVNQGLIPAYLSNLNVILANSVRSIPESINDEQQFNTLANANLANFTSYFAGVRTPSNTPMPQAFLNAVLGEFTRLMPRYTGLPATAVAATPNTRATGAVRVSDTSAPACPEPAPCPGCPSPDAAALKEAGSTLVALASAEIINLRSRLDNTMAIDIHDKFIKQLDEQSAEYTTKLQRTSTEKNALEQQFLDERKTPEKITGSRVRLLQDYLLAGFAISYVLASLVGITYTTLNANSWGVGLAVSSGTATLIGGIVFSLTAHLA